MNPESIQRLDDAIRDVPDFPKPGILFKDITPVLGDPALLQLAIDAIVDTAGGRKVDHVVGIDARGFLFGTPAALTLDAGFVPIRKHGKLPYKTIGRSYSLEYGEAEVEMHVDAVRPGDQVLLVDDLLATGGTAAAAAELVREAGGEIVGITFLIELKDLGGRAALGDAAPVHAVLAY